MSKNRQDEPNLEEVQWIESDLARMLEWVRASESRIAIILPLSTAMLGTIALLFPDVKIWTLGISLVVFIAVLFLVLSLLFVWFACYPRMSGPGGSLIFFGGVAKNSLERYIECLNSRSPEERYNDLVIQCHRNAQIAQQKYRWVKSSMASLLVAVLAWGLAVLFMFSAGA